MKTAKELFNELGYDYNKDDNIIEYFARGEVWYCYVTFDLINEEYSVNENNDFGYVDAKLHRCITKQMEELGWL